MRDQEVINFIQDFGAADSGQIARLFFGGQNQGETIARRRLLEIVERTEIKREKDVYSGRYVYYTTKAQLRHKVLIAEFYVRLKLGPGKLLEFENHYTIGDIRPDAYAAYGIGDKVYLFFLEVQISANPLNIQKYEQLRLSGEWRLPFPRIVVISDRRYCPKTELQYIVIPTSFEGWERIFK